MIVDILISAPSNPATLTNWGDFHYANEIKNAFLKKNISVRILFNDTYRMHHPNQSDYLIVLRGKFKVDTSWRGFVSYKKRFAWCISWPSTYSIEELESYDYLFIASKLHVEYLINKISSKNISTLLQCTAFKEDKIISSSKRQGLCFVGNTRNKTRPVVEKILSLNIPVLLYGNGWDKVGKIAEAFSVSNSMLPRLYSSCIFSLNDHHSDMLEFGYVNNRVYDAIICGSRIIGDHNPQSEHDLIAQNILNVDSIISNPNSFVKEWHNYSSKSVSRESLEYIITYHSFDRAVTLFLAKID